MSTTIAPASKSLLLPAGFVLTVTTGIVSTASVVRLADVPGGGDPASPVEVSAQSAPTFGPFATPTQWRISCLTGAVADSQAPGFAPDVDTDVGFANPMTHAGELIAGGVLGAPVTLANPGAGTFNLQSVDGVLTWTAV